MAFKRLKTFNERRMANLAKKRENELAYLKSRRIVAEKNAELSASIRREKELIRKAEHSSRMSSGLYGKAKRKSVSIRKFAEAAEKKRRKLKKRWPDGPPSLLR